MNNDQKQDRGSVFSAALLVAGTCIGGGMLALPDVTGVGGFFPSVAIIFLCWIMMTLTGLYLIEATLWFPAGAHYLSLSRNLLGRGGESVSWILYLFVCYASLIAYTAEGGGIISDVLSHANGFVFSKGVGAFAFLILFGFVIDLGARLIGRVNAILMIGMVVSYLLLFFGGIGAVQWKYLTHHQWGASLLSIPFFLTSFSHQTMAPSLPPYLQRNGKKIGWAIVGGTSIALIFYLTWLFVVLGMIPFYGEGGLGDVLRRGERVTTVFPLHTAPWMALVAEFFAFFAIVTSFLGIGLGLFDFLADGLSVKKEGKGKILLGLLIFLPTLFFATYFERIFLIAIDTSGGYGDSILSGWIPILMVWMGRYHFGYKGSFRVGGGKSLLIAVFSFFHVYLVTGVCDSLRTGLFSF